MENKNKKTLEDSWNSLNTSLIFPAFTIIARSMPLTFFNGYENGPKTLFNYCLTGALVDLTEICYRVYVKGELGPIPSFNDDSETMKKAQAGRDKNKEEHMSLAKPYSCFEKHIFYDLPKAIYKKIKNRNKK